ncbi:MAG: hypothetical protein HRU07_06590 [Nitrosopumilus sp.]|nr:hypothetical protein [Nitrosopumilus sp.]NRA05808.1 hypothetical protein [Nitrosopumilus sp.]
MMTQSMKPTWEIQEYYPLQNNTQQSVYSFYGSDDDSEYLLELTKIFQVMLEENHPIGTLSLPEPVYVITDGDNEEIRYNSTVMELDKIYEIEWNDKQYGIRKTDKEVEILRFYPDEA